MLETLQTSDFTGHLHQHFSVWLAGGDTLDLQLVEVTAWGAAPSDNRRQPFSLVFRHDRTDLYLPQGMHTLHHAEMGELTLFLVPLGPAPNGMRYEAIFS